MPQDIALRLQRLIELLEPTDANQVVDLLHCLQVQNARLRSELSSFNDPRPGYIQGPHNFVLAAQSTVELRLRSEGMFSFARGRTDRISPPLYDENQIQQAWAWIDGDALFEEFERDQIIGLLTSLPAQERWRGG